jgi:hypothetical protein
MCGASISFAARRFPANWPFAPQAVHAKGAYAKFFDFYNNQIWFYELLLNNCITTTALECAASVDAPVINPQVNQLTSMLCGVCLWLTRETRSHLWASSPSLSCWPKGPINCLPHFWVSSPNFGMSYGAGFINEPSCVSVHVCVLLCMYDHAILFEEAFSEVCSPQEPI